HQMPLNQLRLTRRRHADGHIGFAHAEIEFSVVQQQVDRNVGIDFEELAHARGEPGRAQGDRGRHFELALGPVLALGELGLGHRQLGEHLMSRPVKEFALLGQNQTTGVTMKQGDADAFLQRTDLAADRGLAEVQGLAGMGEASRLGHRMEYAQLVPIHHSAATLSAPPLPLPSLAVSPLASVVARKRSASRAAIQPMPAAVTAWRKILSLTSPAAKTPGTAVAVLSGRVRM